VQIDLRIDSSAARLIRPAQLAHSPRAASRLLALDLRIDNGLVYATSVLGVSPVNAFEIQPLDAADDHARRKERPLDRGGARFSRIIDSMCRESGQGTGVGYR